MTQTVGPYRLIRHLATGGMAEVWLARRHDSDGEEVALKRILPHLARDRRFTSMFLDEAEIGSKLDHENVVTVIEVGSDDGEYFIAMEYVEGPDLAQILDRCEQTGFKVSVGVAAHIVVGVLRALHYAHEFEVDGAPQNIVHRDVSPHNILVTADGEVKLIDFGVAKAVERHSKTETGFVKGKLSYMSPEQIGQEGLDRRADLFGVGALFFELLTGRTPFGRELTAVSAILDQDPPDLHEERDDVPDVIVKAIERSLEKDPEDRWATAGEMADVIEGALEEQDASSASVAQFLAELESSTEASLRETSDLRAGRVTTPASAPQDLLRKAASGGTPAPAPVPSPTKEESRDVELTGALAAQSQRRSGGLVAPAVVLLVLVIGFGGYLGRRQIAAWIGDEPVADVAGAEASERPIEPRSSLDEAERERSEPVEEKAEIAELNSEKPPVESDAEPDEEASDGFTFEEAEAEAVYADAAALRSIELEKPPENWLLEFWGPALIDAVAEPDPEERRWDPGNPEVVAVLDYAPRPRVEEGEVVEAPVKKKPKRRVKKRRKRTPKKVTKRAPKSKPKKKKRDGYKRMENAIPSF